VIQGEMAVGDVTRRSRDRHGASGGQARTVPGRC